MTEPTPRLQAYLDLEPKLPRRRAAVYMVIAESGARGATLREIAATLGAPEALNRFSGRCTELERAGWIRRAGTRDKQTVYVLGLGPNRGRTPKRQQRGKVVEFLGIDHSGGQDETVLVRIQKHRDGRLEVGTPIFWRT